MSNDAFTDGTESDEAAGSPRDGAATDEPSERLERAAQVELLEAENRRLREEYARARQSRYRRTAIGLAAVGLGALCGGLAFPDAREVFVALGATGLFGAVLTYYLAPGRFVAADVGERVYAAAAANGRAIATELGLGDDRVYLPPDGAGGPRLYVPQHPDYEVPADRDGPFALESGERGLLLEPTGGPLFDAFERTLTDDLATTPEGLASQLCEGVVEGFELAAGAEPDVDAATGRVTVAVTDSAFGAVDRFDHPIGSFVAVGLARGLERPVELEVDAGDGRADWLVTCRFDVTEDRPDEFEWVESSTHD